jgi:hypothetical protein
MELYDFGKLNWYPHMMPEDVAVWERFIESRPNAYETCYYDFPVGSVPDYVANDPDVDMASMEKLYKKKIDVVAFDGAGIDIIELKPACTMSTVGQVKGYKHFYMRDIRPPKEPRVVVICGAASRDVIEYANAEGVMVVVV